MGNFFRDLLSDSGNVSSKRFKSLCIMVVIITMVMGSQFSTYKLDMAVLLTLISAMLALDGMNAAIQMKGIEVKKDVASDIVNSTGDTDAAKDTLQSDKP